MPYATTDDDVKLYYEEAGEGTPILFIHEFADDHRSWRPQFNYFARNYRCISYNARGYPPSDVPETDDSYGQLRAVQDARDVLRHLGIEKAHIVGLSMGGFASLHFGLNFPEMALSLTVAGCGYGAGGDREQWQRETREIAARFIDLGMEGVSSSYAYGPTRVQFENKDPVGFAAFVARFNEHSPLGSANTFIGVQGRRPSLYDLQDEMRALKLPTLIMTGDEDDPCLEPNLMMKGLITTSWLVMMPQSGHAINLEEPDQFNSHLQAFLHTVDTGKFKARDDRSIGKSVTGLK